jgi:four helix bundle protein
MTQRHEGLVAWQRADDLCVELYRITRDRFPREEKYGLAAQVRRAGYSVPANIVEGYADRSNKWRLRYLRIAVGSIAKVGYALHLAHRLGYLSDDEYANVQKDVSGVAAPLHGLVASVRAELEKSPNV